MKLLDVRTIKNPTNWRVILVFDKNVSIDITLPNGMSIHDFSKIMKQAIHSFSLQVGG